MSTWEDGTRITTVHSRFSVSDECCGTVETWSTRADAIACARSHWRRHISDGGVGVPVVAVFDTMARRNAPNTWHVDMHGQVAERPRGTEIEARNNP